MVLLLDDDSLLFNLLIDEEMPLTNESRLPGTYSVVDISFGILKTK